VFRGVFEIPLQIYNIRRHF